MMPIVLIGRFSDVVSTVESCLAAPFFCKFDSFAAHPLTIITIRRIIQKQIRINFEFIVSSLAFYAECRINVFKKWLFIANISFMSITDFWPKAECWIKRC
jgi:hypothetical protein